MSEDGEAKWPCPQCTFLNPDYSPTCEICDISRTDADHTIQVYANDPPSHDTGPALGHEPAPDQTSQLHNEIAAVVDFSSGQKDDASTLFAPETISAATRSHSDIIPPLGPFGDDDDGALLYEEEPAQMGATTAAATLTPEEELELQRYCDSIEFPPPPQDEAQGLESLAEHLRSAYAGKSYLEVLREYPEGARKLYHRYFAVVCPLKNLSFGSAIEAWDALSFDTVFKSYAEWKQFLLHKQKLKGSISKDGWQMLWAFAESEDRLLNEYSTDEAWPSIIDSFVEWKYEKEGRTFKSESTFTIDTSAFDYRWNTTNGDSSSRTGDSPSAFLSSSVGGASSSVTSMFSTSYSWTSDYRGLYNQGATCYMNSLLQTLFMTPEFRRSLYLWKGGKGLTQEEEDDSIPLQLQRLFARLQFGEGSAVSTQALTKSFGWDSGQSFVQQDAQELCRVLFDVIEEHFAGTSEEHVIQELYQGRVKDYVQCTVCGYESSRPDKFLDISLDIHQVSNLTEALDKFVTPEILSGSSRWRCSKCDALVDARKGLKIVELPYILMVQLKRFDYDYDRDHRIKLNHLIEFPYHLSLDKYVDDSFEPEAITHPDTPARGKGGGRGSEGANSMGGKTIREQRQVLLDSVARLQESLLDPPSALLADHYRSEIERHQATLKLLDEQESKEREEAANQALAAAEEEIAKGKEAAKDHVDDGTSKATTTTYNKKRKGETDSETMVSGADEAKGHSSGLDTMESSTTAPEHSYELYSVLVHSGSATGGHYYAYIKSFEKNKWYEFNDSYVTEVSEEKVKQAYGSDDGRGSIMGTSWGCSAYMLCYRRVDADRNISSVLAEEVDEELRNIKDVESAATPWTFNFAEKDKRKWHRDSSDDEADNERGNTSDDMEVGDEDWDTGSLDGEYDFSAATTTSTTATEVIVATKEVLSEEEDLELLVVYRHSTGGGGGGDPQAESMLEEKRVRVSSNATLNHLLKKLKVAFDLPKIDESALELSDYDPVTQQVGHPYRSWVTLSNRLRDEFIDSESAFLLEVKPQSANLWFSNFDSDLALVLLVFEVLPTSSEGSTTEGSPAECEFSAPKKVFIQKQGTLLDLKQAIHRVLGDPLTPDKQRVIHSPSSWNTKDLCESRDSTPLSTLYLFDKDKIYVEYCEDLSTPSPALTKLRGSFSFSSFASTPLTAPSTWITSSDSSSSSSSASSSSTASSWRPKEKGIQIRRRADRPLTQSSAEESQRDPIDPPPPLP